MTIAAVHKQVDLELALVPEKQGLPPLVPHNNDVYACVYMYFLYLRCFCGCVCLCCVGTQYSAACTQKKLRLPLPVRPSALSKSEMGVSYATTPRRGGYTPWTPKELCTCVSVCVGLTVCRRLFVRVGGEMQGAWGYTTMFG